ncbi:Ephrin type-A receptor 4 [Ceratobasidium sp. AG-Ba]|nr:Ephrin type-A receptor 4 [Ceratobasidium sp. AG-Ba]
MFNPVAHESQSWRGTSIGQMNQRNDDDTTSLILYDPFIPAAICCQHRYGLNRVVTWVNIPMAPRRYALPDVETFHIFLDHSTRVHRHYSLSYMDRTVYWLRRCTTSNLGVRDLQKRFYMEVPSNERRWSHAQDVPKSKKTPTHSRPEDRAALVSGALARTTSEGDMRPSVIQGYNTFSLSQDNATTAEQMVFPDESAAAHIYCMGAIESSPKIQSLLCTKTDDRMAWVYDAYVDSTHGEHPAAARSHPPILVGITLLAILGAYVRMWGIEPLFEDLRSGFFFQLGPRTTVPLSIGPSGDQIVLEQPNRTTAGSDSVEGANACTYETRMTATTITSTMGVGEVIPYLIERGCLDITDKLEVSQINNRPVAWGGFGAIYRSRLQDGTLVAVKYLKLDDADVSNGCKTLKRTAREIYAWSKCSHPGILPLYGIARIGENLAMVSPWMKRGSLRSFLRTNPSFDRFRLCLQLASALEYMHSHEIVHGDIKPDNIVVSDDNTLMFTDFGNSILGYSSTLQFTATSSPVTLRYTAPEILTGNTMHTKEGDVYAFGMTLFETLTGEVPFANKSSIATVYPVINGQIPNRKDFLLKNKTMGDQLWDLLTKCWAYDPKARPSATELNEQLTLIG